MGRRRDFSTGDAAGEAPAISARGLVKGFGRGAARIIALDHVSLDIRQNEFFTLLGPSGCGKTTLLRMIAGFELPDQGGVLLHGEEIAHLPPHKRPVNTVFQSYALFPHLNVAQNIGFGLEMLGWSREKTAAAVQRMLELVRLEPLADRAPDQLSGGQQQRVALARALAPQPRVLLLDEPLAALDLKLRKEMQLELKRLQDETGITFVFVTHDQEEALTMSDRIAVMNAGKVQQIGAPQDIYNAPANRFVADFIGDINILTGLPLRDQAGGLTVRLGGEAEIFLPGASMAGDRVSVAIRPEKARECDASADNALHGTVTHVVFFGAGANIHLTLGDGAAFILRLQGDAGGHAVGDRIAFRIDEGGARALGD